MFLPGAEIREDQGARLVSLTEPARYDDSAVFRKAARPPWTFNNRLMKCVTNDISGGATTPLSTTWYYYNESGNVTRPVTSPEGSDDHSATLLGYAKNGSTVSFVVGETWNGGDVEGTYNITYAREFRYDSARERYLNRELDPVALQSTGALLAVQATWTDYDDESAYGDFTVDPGTGDVANTRGCEPGIVTFSMVPFGTGLWAPDPASAEYYGDDLIGTTRRMTDVNKGKSRVRAHLVISISVESRRPLDEGLELPRRGIAGCFR